MLRRARRHCRRTEGQALRRRGIGKPSKGLAKACPVTIRHALAQLHRQHLTGLMCADVGHPPGVKGRAQQHKGTKVRCRIPAPRFCASQHPERQIGRRQARVSLRCRHTTRVYRGRKVPRRLKVRHLRRRTRRHRHRRRQNQTQPHSASRCQKRPKSPSSARMPGPVTPTCPLQRRRIAAT